MLKEVIIVEGKMDTVAVKRALECDTIETGGFALNPHTLKKIEAAYKKRGIIILTDPDGSGERIRKFLTARFPDAGQAFVPKKDARVPDDVGIEQAKPEAILLALSKVHHHEYNPEPVFSVADLRDNGLSGSADECGCQSQTGFAGCGTGHRVRYGQSVFAPVEYVWDYAGRVCSCSEKS